MWTGVYFSVGVVAPPGERSVGAGRGRRCFEGSSDAVGGRRQRLFQEFLQRRLGGFWKRPTVLDNVAYRRDKSDDQEEDEPGVHLPHPEAALWIVGGLQ